MPLSIWLFIAAAVGGALNAVAGGGSFLTLPALIVAGVSPVVANATSTLALWPASLSSTVAYRRELRSSRQWLVVLGVTSVLGGLAGALLLVRTSDDAFLRLLPWLMLVAAATFTFGNRLRPAPKAGAARSHPFERGAAWRPALLGVVLAQLLIATYGGYFGGGMGIMMLATMALAGSNSRHFSLARIEDAGPGTRQDHRLHRTLFSDEEVHRHDPADGDDEPADVTRVDGSRE